MISQILTHQEIQYKIRRIAYQIYESNTQEKKIFIAGMTPNGYPLAKKIAIEFNKISDIKTTLCKLELNQKNALEASLSIDLNLLKNKSLVLVDDVLNSGHNLIYGVRYFLGIPLKHFKTAVLVNRNHKKYPVKADFKGISLSTSINENVRVCINHKKEQDAVFLE